MDVSLRKHQELVTDNEAWRPWGRKELDMTEWLNWTEEAKIVKKIKIVQFLF